MDEGEICPVCAEKKEKNKLRVFHINFEESLLVCDNAKCTYPLGLKSTESIVIKRKCQKPDGRETKKKKVCDAVRSSGMPHTNSVSLITGKTPGLLVDSGAVFSICVPPLENREKLTQCTVRGTNTSQLGKTRVWEGYATGALNNTPLDSSPLVITSQSAARSGKNLPKLALNNNGCFIANGSMQNNPDHMLHPECSSTAIKRPGIGGVTEGLRTFSKPSPLSKLPPYMPQYTLSPADWGFFLQWENQDALCWLDVVLCFLVHNKSVHRTLKSCPAKENDYPLIPERCLSEENSGSGIQTGSANHGATCKFGSLDNSLKDLDARNLVRTLVVAYEQAMKLSNSVRSKAQTLHMGQYGIDMVKSSVRRSSENNPPYRTLQDLNGPDTQLHSAELLVSQAAKSSFPVSTESSPSSPPKPTSALQTLLSNVNRGVPLKTGAGNGATRRTTPTSFAELASEDTGFSKARTILNGMREKVWQELQPKLRCEKGRNDSPVFAIPFLLHSDPDICHLFQTTYKFETRCSKCGSTKIERYTKVLPSLPKVAPDFSMRNVAHLRDCFTCKAPNQKRVLQFESLAQCAMIHFVEGLPTSDLSVLDFSLGDCSFHVTAVVQYKADPSHFVIWIRHERGTLWMECDDLKGPLCRYRLRTPSIPANQIHIVFWERGVIQSDHSPSVFSGTELRNVVYKPLQESDKTVPVSKEVGVDLKRPPSASRETSKSRPQASRRAQLLTKALNSTTFVKLPSASVSSRTLKTAACPKSGKRSTIEVAAEQQPSTSENRATVSDQLGGKNSGTPLSVEGETSEESGSAEARMLPTLSKLKRINRTLSFMVKMKGTVGRALPLTCTKPDMMPKSEAVTGKPPQESGGFLVDQYKEVNSLTTKATATQLKTEEIRGFPGSFSGNAGKVLPVTSPGVPQSAPHTYLEVLKPFLKEKPKPNVKFPDHQYEGYKLKAPCRSVSDMGLTVQDSKAASPLAAAAIPGSNLNLCSGGIRKISLKEPGKASVCLPKKRKSSPWSSPKKRRDLMLPNTAPSCRPRASMLTVSTDRVRANLLSVSVEENANLNSRNSVSNPVPIGKERPVSIATETLVPHGTSNPDPISKNISINETDQFLDSLLCNDVDTLVSQTPVIDCAPTVPVELEIPDMLNMIQAETPGGLDIKARGVNCGDIAKHSEVLKDLYQALDLNISIHSCDSDEGIFKKPHSKTA